MNTEKMLKVTEIQRFCMHDGAGVRTTVFLKGCPLRCRWCHNPETQKMSSELLFYSSKCIGCAGCMLVCPKGAHTVGERRSIDRERCTGCFSCVENCPTGALESCGDDMTVEEILRIVERDRDFYGEKGGMTLSGGEPFAQGEAVTALLKECKARGITTAVETCGYADPEIILSAVPYVDTFLFDLKDTDAERHKRYTGVSNERILDNLRLINDAGARIRLRCIMVNGVNTDRDHYERLGKIASSIKNFDGIDLIEYHAYGGSKAAFIGKADSGRSDWIPSSEQIREAKETLKKMRVIKENA